MASDKVKHISDSDFDSQVLKSTLPVLVDFWAPWCGPCKAIGPVIDELAEEYDGKVVIAKMNVDDNPRHPWPVWDPRHPHPDPLQGRRGVGPGDRCGGQVPDRGHDPEGAVTASQLEGLQTRLLVC